MALFGRQSKRVWSYKKQSLKLFPFISGNNFFSRSPPLFGWYGGQSSRNLDDEGVHSAVKMMWELLNTALSQHIYNIYCTTYLQHIHYKHKHNIYNIYTTYTLYNINTTYTTYIQHIHYTTYTTYTTYIQHIYNIYIIQHKHNITTYTR